MTKEVWISYLGCGCDINYSVILRTDISYNFPNSCTGGCHVLRTLSLMYVTFRGKITCHLHFSLCVGFLNCFCVVLARPFCINWNIYHYMKQSRLMGKHEVKSYITNAGELTLSLLPSWPWESTFLPIFMKKTRQKCDCVTAKREEILWFTTYNK